MCLQHVIHTSRYFSQLIQCIFNRYVCQIYIMDNNIHLWEYSFHCPSYQITVDTCGGPGQAHGMPIVVQAKLTQGLSVIPYEKIDNLQEYYLGQLLLSQ